MKNHFHIELLLVACLMFAISSQESHSQEDPFKDGKYVEESEISSEDEYSKTLFHFIQETTPKGCKLMHAQNYHGVFITIIKSPLGRAVVNTWVHDKKTSGSFGFSFLAGNKNNWGKVKWLGTYNSRYRVFDESARLGRDFIILRPNGMIFSFDPKAKFTKLEFGMEGYKDLVVVVPWQDAKKKDTRDESK